MGLSVTITEGWYYAALVFEGARAIHDVGFFGIGAKSYYPASIIPAVDRMWREHGDMMPARTRLIPMPADQNLCAQSRSPMDS